MSRIKASMIESMPGCVFEYQGKVPETVYQPGDTHTSVEQAVYNCDIDTLNRLVKDGEEISVRLKIGQMSCLEFAAMMGYAEVLKILIDSSINATVLKEYFSLADVVERAYLISHNKKLFFDQEALAEANRYEAALYTAIEYNQPQCVEVMLHHLGNKQLGKYLFITQDTNREKLSATELALIRGHTECYNMLLRTRQFVQ